MKDMVTIEATPGVWVAATSKELAEAYATEVRANRPFLTATVNHPSSDVPLTVVSIQKPKRPDQLDDPPVSEWMVDLAKDEIHSAMVVPWRECTWA